MAECGKPAAFDIYAGDPWSDEGSSFFACEKHARRALGCMLEWQDKCRRIDVRDGWGQTCMFEPEEARGIKAYRGEVYDDMFIEPRVDICEPGELEHWRGRALTAEAELAKLRAFSGDRPA